MTEPTALDSFLREKPYYTILRVADNLDSLPIRRACSIGVSNELDQLRRLLINAANDLYLARRELSSLLQNYQAAVDPEDPLEDTQ